MSRSWTSSGSFEGWCVRGSVPATPRLDSSAAGWKDWCPSALIPDANSVFNQLVRAARFLSMW